MRTRNTSKNSAAVLPHTVALAAVVVAILGRVWGELRTVFDCSLLGARWETGSYVGMYAGRQDTCVSRSISSFSFTLAY